MKTRFLFSAVLLCTTSVYATGGASPEREDLASRTELPAYKKAFAAFNELSDIYRAQIVAAKAAVVAGNLVEEGTQEGSWSYLILRAEDLVEQVDKTLREQLKVLSEHYALIDAALKRHEKGSEVSQSLYGESQSAKKPRKESALLEEEMLLTAEKKTLDDLEEANQRAEAVLPDKRKTSAKRLTSVKKEALDEAFSGKKGDKENILFTSDASAKDNVAAASADDEKAEQKKVRTSEDSVSNETE